MKKYTLFFFVVAFVCLSCEETHNHSTTSTVDSSTTSIVNEAAKTDEEVKAELIKEGAKDLTALVKEARIEKNRRDSVFAANREEVWVYQIGTNKNDVKDFEQTYQVLSSKLTNLYFFKRSRNDYYLIHHDGYNSEQELMDEQPALEKTLADAGIKESVRVINITTYCSMKDAIKPAAEVKLKRKEMAVCYTCD